MYDALVDDDGAELGVEFSDVLLRVVDVGVVPLGAGDDDRGRYSGDLGGLYRRLGGRGRALMGRGGAGGMMEPVPPEVAPAGFGVARTGRALWHWRAGLAAFAGLAAVV